MTNLLLSILTGILLTLSFPKFNFSFLAWIALVPLLIVVYNTRPKTAFLFGLIAGATTYCGILYWIVPTFTAAGEPRILGIFCLLLLAIYCGLYVAVFCALNSFLSKSLPLCRSRFRRNKRGIKGDLPFAPAFLWVSLEYIRAHLFSGFPWGIIGYSQWNFLQIIQIADITGIYGVSFLIVTVNTALSLILAPCGRGEGEGNIKIQNLIVATVLFSFVLVYGIFSLKNYTGDKLPSIKIAVLQGNIDQYKKWDNSYRQEIIEAYTKLVKKAMKYKPDIVVWPESAVPGYLLMERDLYDWVKGLAIQSKCYHLVGTVQCKDKNIYNSAFIFTPDGRLLDEYSKIHLVPFGETIPLKPLLSRYIKTLNELGDISSGDRHTVFSINPTNKIVLRTNKIVLRTSRTVNLSTNICFEAIFPDLIRRFSKHGSDIIVNITNDGWYLKTSAPYQHFVFNIFRAIENRKPVVRSANTGISGFIDSRGVVLKQTEIFTAACSVMDVQPLSKKTFYTKYGDVFAYFCLLATVIIVILSGQTVSRPDSSTCWG